jgi:hypothetical protein
MKKLLLFTVLITGLSFVPASDGVSKKEKKSAAKFLKDAEKSILNSVKGLSENQLKFKPAPDKWSVEDCIKHIAATEIALWKMTETNINSAVNPEKRADIKWTDADVIKNIEDRSSRKVKTSPNFEPENTGFKTMEEAITSFTETGTNSSIISNTPTQIFATMWPLYRW